MNPGLSACKADALPLSYTPAQFRRDSNPQPPDSKSDTLSIAPRNFRTRATDDRGRLVVDAALEARRAPVDELDRALGLDRGDRGVDVLVFWRFFWGRRWRLVSAARACHRAAFGK